jgi:hypothetical protein
MIKLFTIGLVIGAVVTAPLAYNLGRGAPLLSNPFEERTLGTVVKEKAKNIAEEVKDGVKELTK